MHIIIQWLSDTTTSKQNSVCSILYYHALSYVIYMQLTKPSVTYYPVHISTQLSSQIAFVVYFIIMLPFMSFICNWLTAKCYLLSCAHHYPMPFWHNTSKPNSVCSILYHHAPLMSFTCRVSTLLSNDLLSEGDFERRKVIGQVNFYQDWSWEILLWWSVYNKFVMIK